MTKYKILKGTRVWLWKENGYLANGQSVFITEKDVTYTEVDSVAFASGDSLWHPSAPPLEGAGEMYKFKIPSNIRGIAALEVSPLDVVVTNDEI